MKKWYQVAAANLFRYSSRLLFSTLSTFWFPDAGMQTKFFFNYQQAVFLIARGTSKVKACWKKALDTYVDKKWRENHLYKLGQVLLIYLQSWFLTNHIQKNSEFYWQTKNFYSLITILLKTTKKFFDTKTYFRQFSTSALNM